MSAGMDGIGVLCFCMGMESGCMLCDGLRRGCRVVLYVCSTELLKLRLVNKASAHQHAAQRNGPMSDHECLLKLRCYMCSMLYALYSISHSRYVFYPG